MTSSEARRESFIWLDVARALAAILVLSGHLRAYVFNDSVASRHLSAAWKGFYFLTSMQHQAVIVFFVLSGFLISKTVSEQVAAGKWSWGQYAVKRLCRLWIVLLPALLLTLIWDQLGMRLTGSPLYSGGLNAVNHSTPMGPLSFSLPTFFGNIFFLQNILVPPFGTDTPLWSLANEFWYYVIFPLFFLACRSTYRLSSRLGLVIAGTALCMALQPAQRYLGIVWLLGYLAYRLQRKLRLSSPKYRRLSTTVAAIVFLAVIISSKVFKIDDVIQDFITGIAFALLVVPLSTLDANRQVGGLTTFFAGFSYTLYVVHFPFLAFVTSALTHNARVAPSLHGLTIFALLFTSVLLYAYLISLVFERNTPVLQLRIRHYIQGIRMSGRSPKIALRTE